MGEEFLSDDEAMNPEFWEPLVQYVYEAAFSLSHQPLAEGHCLMSDADELVDGGNTMATLFISVMFSYVGFSP
jgi:hypothetical protein